MKIRWLQRIQGLIEISDLRKTQNPIHPDRRLDFVLVFPIGNFTIFSRRWSIVTNKMSFDINLIIREKS